MLCDKEHLTAALLNEKYYFAECTSVFMAGEKMSQRKIGGGGVQGSESGGFAESFDRKSGDKAFRWDLAPRAVEFWHYVWARLKGGPDSECYAQTSVLFNWAHHCRSLKSKAHFQI